MAAKILIAALAVVCAFSACGAINADLVELAENVQNAGGIFEMIVSKSLDMIDATVTGAAKKWQGMLEDSLSEAAGQGLDVSKCTGFKDKLSAFVEEVRADSKKCLDREIAQGKAHLQALQPLIVKLDAVLDKSQKETQACAGVDACVKSVAEKYEQDFDSLDEQLTSAFMALTADVFMVQNSAGGCSTKKLSNAEESAMQIVFGSAFCIVSNNHLLN